MKRLGLLALACLMLTACTITAPKKIDPAQQQIYWQQHQQAVDKIRQYRLRGSFAYLSATQKNYANFFWQQYSDQHYTLRLTTTFGTTILELSYQPGLAKLTDQQGQVYIGDSTEALIQQLAKMTIPLSQLQQWLLGLPGNATEIQLNDQARLQQARLSQQGSIWLLNINEYDERSQPPLPKRVELIRNDETIRLRIERWTL